MSSDKAAEETFRSQREEPGFTAATNTEKQDGAISLEKKDGNR